MALPVLTKRRFQPEFAAWAIFLHVGALILLPLYFSWGYLAFGFFMAVITAHSMGIFHHMYLTHSSFRAHPALEALGALLGTLSWRGPMAAPLRYVALHRVHHSYSDREADPHSPIHGIFHAFLGWNWFFAPVFADQKQYLRWAGPHRHKPFLLFLDRHVHLLQLAYGLILFGIGGSIGYLTKGEFDFHGAMATFAFGVFAKTLFVVYLANTVDVINHGPGYRNYETRDLSTNSFIMAAIHWGGAISWHNNHHGRPSYFSVKRKWWEFDIHLHSMRALQSIGLVSHIKELDETGADEKDHKLTHYLNQDTTLAAGMISLRLGQFILPLVAFLFAMPYLSSTPQIVAVALLAPLSAIGLHNLALLGHEGTHFNLAKNKLLSSMLGSFFASMVPFHFNTGFALSHAAHHVHANTEKDPDVAVFAPYKTLWSRLIQARRAASLEYFIGTMKAAFGKSGAVKLPGLKAGELRFLAFFNIVASVSFLALYVFLCVKFGLAFTILFVATYSLTFALSAIRPYLEHAGTDAQKYSNSRTFASPALDVVFGGINYHLAHHLYPRVPAYRIARFQKWLNLQDEFRKERKVMDRSPARLYKAAARLPYGRR